MRDGRTNEQLKIELLSQWKLEAEFRNKQNNQNRAKNPTHCCPYCLPLHLQHSRLNRTQERGKERKGLQLKHIFKFTQRTFRDMQIFLQSLQFLQSFCECVNVYFLLMRYI